MRGIHGLAFSATPSEINKMTMLGSNNIRLRPRSPRSNWVCRLKHGDIPSTDEISSKDRSLPLPQMHVGVSETKSWKSGTKYDKTYVNCEGFMVSKDLLGV
jgi:hypothetical protein